MPAELRGGMGRGASGCAGPGRVVGLDSVPRLRGPDSGCMATSKMRLLFRMCPCTAPGGFSGLPCCTGFGTDPPACSSAKLDWAVNYINVVTLYPGNG